VKKGTGVSPQPGITKQRYKKGKKKFPLNHVGKKGGTRRRPAAGVKSPRDGERKRKCFLSKERSSGRDARWKSIRGKKKRTFLFRKKTLGVAVETRGQERERAHEGREKEGNQWGN